MKFNVNQQDLQQALNYCQGVIEKRSTLAILSNVLLNASNSSLTITATDLDLIFIHQINNVEVIEEGNTTTTSSIMYDIILKYSVPEFIEKNTSLTQFIIEIADAKIEDGGSGAFYIYLKNKNKFKE